MQQAGDPADATGTTATATATGPGALMHLWYVLAWIAAVLSVVAAVVSAATINRPRPVVQALPVAVLFLALAVMCYLVPLAFKIHSA